MDLKTYLDSKPWGESLRLANAIGEKPSNVSLWRKGKKPIPPYKCMRIFLYTRGAVTLQELRPNDYEECFPVDAMAQLWSGK